jgi:hypothetical protein
MLVAHGSQGTAGHVAARCSVSREARSEATGYAAVRSPPL